LQAPGFEQPAISAALHTPSLSVSPSVTVPVPVPGFGVVGVVAQLQVLQPVAYTQSAGSLMVMPRVLPGAA
jgi:hypothetical protein